MRQGYTYTATSYVKLQLIKKIPFVKRAEVNWRFITSTSAKKILAAHRVIIISED